MWLGFSLARGGITMVGLASFSGFRITEETSTRIFCKDIIREDLLEGKTMLYDGGTFFQWAAHT